MTPNVLKAAIEWAERTLDYGLLNRPEDEAHLRTILSDHARLSAALGEARGWRPISEHDNSRDPVLVEDKHGRPVVAWRHHPSSRTDEFLTIPGDWRVPYPTRFATLPSRARTALQQQEARDGRE